MTALLPATASYHLAVAVTALFPNHLASERAALGLTREQLAERAALDPQLYAHMEDGRILPNHVELDRITAALGGIEPARIYAYSLVNTIGDKRLKVDNPDYQSFFEAHQESSRLLVAPEELMWLDKNVIPDRKVDFFINMSCGTQGVPNLILDIASVMQALGVSFAAGAGRLFCCGTYYRRNGHYEQTQRMNAAANSRTVAWGAQTAIHMCTQCVNTFSEISARDQIEHGGEPQVEHTQVMRFLVEKLDELGDRVPWKTEIKRKVLVHGHSSYSYVHHRAKMDVAAIAKRIPGIEFLGFVDRMSIDSFCDSEPGVPRRPKPKTRDEVETYRAELRDVAASWGADTISPSHQGCYKTWSRFSSEPVAVRHVVSLLADALGVGHPDRHQAAAHLGEPRDIVEQTRPIWTKWGLNEADALGIAQRTFDPSYSDADRCQCGKSRDQQCGHDDFITVDVLAGTTRR